MRQRSSLLLVTIYETVTAAALPAFDMFGGVGPGEVPALIPSISRIQSLQLFSLFSLGRAKRSFNLFDQH